jgi:hypothetical protein
MQLPKCYVGKLWHQSLGYSIAGIPRKYEFRDTKSRRANLPHRQKAGNNTSYSIFQGTGE